MNWERMNGEFLTHFPSGRAAMLAHSDDRFTLIDLLLVISADVHPKFRTRQPEDGKSAAFHFLAHVGKANSGQNRGADFAK